MAALSIYANDLVGGKNVSHGTIREVSLVLAGANPGALIDTMSIAHSMGMDYDFDDEEITEAYIYHGVDDSIESEDEEDQKEEEPETSDENVNDDNNETEDSKDGEDSVEHSADGPTAKQVFD